MKRIWLLLGALLAYAGLVLGAVNVNNATKEQLESLDGIGPVKAQAIIDYRTKNGPFKSLEDLKKVNGIGDATYDKIRKDVSLTGATSVPAKAGAKPAEKAAEKKAEPKKAEPKKEDKKAEAKPDAKKEAAEAKKAEAKKDEKKTDAKKDEKKADAKKDEKKEEEKKK